jgi:hypothetical protein
VAGPWTGKPIVGDHRHGSAIVLQDVRRPYHIAQVEQKVRHPNYLSQPVRDRQELSLSRALEHDLLLGGGRVDCSLPHLRSSLLA